MKIKNSKYLIQAVAEAGWPKDGKNEYLFLGRSNVGKSSLINKLTNNSKLAKTSQTPGKTQTLVFFDINDGDFRIVDAPGYGYAKVPDKIKIKFGDMMDEYLEKRTNLKAIFSLVDSRHEPSNDDKTMIEYLTSTNKNFYIIATKCDKHSNNQMTKVKKRFAMYGDRVIYTSAKSGIGISEILNIMG